MLGQKERGEEKRLKSAKILTNHFGVCSTSQLLVYCRRRRRRSEEKSWLLFVGVTNERTLLLLPLGQPCWEVTTLNTLRTLQLACLPVCLSAVGRLVGRSGGRPACTGLPVGHR